MKQKLLVFTFSATAFLLGTAPMMLADQQRCTVATLQGTFGYTVSGSINPGAVLPPGPFAAVGKLTFNGVGGVSTVRTLSDNGTVIRGDSGTGTYTVNSDCTGTFSISIATPSGTVMLNLDLVLDDQTNEIRAIVTNSGYILTLQGRRQFPNSSGKD